jgi:hypothetical protein
MEPVLELVSFGCGVGVVVDVAENGPDDVPDVSLDVVGVEMGAVAAVLGPPAAVGTDVVEPSIVPSRSAVALTAAWSCCS